MIVSVRAASNEDAPLIDKLNRACFGYTYDLCDLAVCLKVALADPRQRVLVAELGGAFAGYLHAQLLTPLEEGFVCYVHALAVEPRFRRLGVAKRLLVEAEIWGGRMGVTRMSLHTGSERVGAQAFYRAMGYSMRKEQKHFIKPGRGRED